MLIITYFILPEWISQNFAFLNIRIIHGVFATNVVMNIIVYPIVKAREVIETTDYAFIASIDFIVFVLIKYPVQFAI